MLKFLDIYTYIQKKENKSYVWCIKYTEDECFIVVINGFDRDKMLKYKHLNMTYYILRLKLYLKLYFFFKILNKRETKTIFTILVFCFFSMYGVFIINDFGEKKFSFIKIRTVDLQDYIRIDQKINCL